MHAIFVVAKLLVIFYLGVNIAVLSNISSSCVHLYASDLSKEMFGD